MIYPFYLRDNATIGIVAPSSPCNLDIIRYSCRLLNSYGYTVIPGESCFSKHGYFAGNDQLRAHDINSMFEDKSIDAIFCLRGGYGCSRICEFLNKKIISQNPKIFLGFSDITVLHGIFNAHCDIVTLHGPVVSSLNEASLNECIRILKGGECMVTGKYVYNQMQCDGIVCGGNLTLIESLIGTENEVDVNDKILILEDVGEKNYAIDRKLTHLKQAGYFRKCKAIVMGCFNEGDGHISENNLPLHKIVEEIIVPEGKPVIMEAPFGHIKLNPTIPLGAKGMITEKTLSIPSAVAH